MNGVDLLADTNVFIYALKQEYSIKIPDSIVAATSIYSGLPLVTADTDFKKIKNINLVLLNLT
jgi:predicted nucleic acid-binding protein